jgi:hypothetical protein
VSRRVIALVAGGAILIGAVVVLLVTGGAEAPADFADPTGDVTVGDGPKPPTETALADIVKAEVLHDGNDIVFRAEMNADIPQRVKGESMSWRWDVLVSGTSAWIVSANLDIGPNASVTSTQSNYGSSTFDDTLPGDLDFDGRTITITLRPAEIDDFPTDFDWKLGTSLDGDQGSPSSALATDTAPDQGQGRLQ